MNKSIKIGFLWLFIALCLNFHTQYELTGLFWGKDLAQPDATGEVPFFMHILVLIVNLIPLLMALLSLYLSAKAFRWFSLIYAGLFALLNTFHIFEQATTNIKDLTQVILLTIVLAANVLLLIELNSYRKEVI